MSDFETRLQRLENIGTKLKSGEISIDEATLLFEEGMTLSRQLEKELQKMERRIEIVTSNTENVEEPAELGLFDSEDGDEPESD